MPPGGMVEARRLAIVYLDPPHGFLMPFSSVSRAFCCELLRLQVELVPSGVGAMYARFRTPAAREAAIAHGDFFFDNVRISLGREEISGCAPPREFLCALIWASPFPAEHSTHAASAWLSPRWASCSRSIR
jgi:hypothetical protein